jgi:hypothetical protein
MTESEAHGLRLLVFGAFYYGYHPYLCSIRLDGGDLRCLSQLKMLAEFLHRVQWRRNSAKPLLACEYFNMIGGVGPAG